MHFWNLVIMDIWKFSIENTTCKKWISKHKEKIIIILIGFLIFLLSHHKFYPNFFFLQSLFLVFGYCKLTQNEKKSQRSTQVKDKNRLQMLVGRRDQPDWVDGGEKHQGNSISHCWAENWNYSWSYFFLFSGWHILSPLSFTGALQRRSQNGISSFQHGKVCIDLEVNS